MKLATAAYPLDILNTWADYESKLTDWVTQAADAGADLMVFPEYGAMELASLDGPADDMETALRSVDRYLPRADDLHDRLARQHQVTILAASAPAFDNNPRPANRARLFGPDGPIGQQDKQIMTMVERDIAVVPGAPLQVFDTTLGRVGVLICYDGEFPDLGRALVDAGVQIILAPSFTKAVSGYWRVRIGAMARAALS